MNLIRRLMWWLVAVVVVVAMVGCAFYYIQDKIVFHPSHYANNEPHGAGLERLNYKTEDGDQLAYYLAPDGAMSKLPRRLWLMFCGNASLALDLRFLADTSDIDPAMAAGVEFLFIDYPGYGECAGRASREGIHRNVAASVKALADQIGVDSELLWERAECFGHSLGAAVAMETAAEHGIEDVVVVSPFTSIEAMAARTTGAPVSGWIRNNFDNQVALAKVAALPDARVYLFHGEEDRGIPVTMGRELAAAHPDVVIYEEMADTAHNDIVGKIADKLRTILFR